MDGRDGFPRGGWSVLAPSAVGWEGVGGPGKGREHGRRDLASRDEPFLEASQRAAAAVPGLALEEERGGGQPSDVVSDASCGLVRPSAAERLARDGAALVDPVEKAIGAEPSVGGGEGEA